jgi:hypothetical protein
MHRDTAGASRVPRQRKSERSRLEFSLSDRTIR